MNMSTRNPNEPIENLAIGQIIEVDGSRLVAELNPTLSELSRVYAGETIPSDNLVPLSESISGVGSSTRW